MEVTKLYLTAKLVAKTNKSIIAANTFFEVGSELGLGNILGFFAIIDSRDSRRQDLRIDICLLEFYNQVKYFLAG